MTNSETTFAEAMAKWQAEREAANKAARNELLPQLRGLGITEVTAEYEGYGDSGNIEDVTVQPVGIALPYDLATKLGDFAWSVAYHQHPGFENNEGGYGELTWALETDKIDVSHSNRFIETDTTEHEGL